MPIQKGVLQLNFYDLNFTGRYEIIAEFKET